MAIEYQRQSLIPAAPENLVSPISIAPAVEPAMIDRSALGPFVIGRESSAGFDAILSVGG
jgi:hypothetical protein